MIRFPRFTASTLLTLAWLAMAGCQQQAPPASDPPSSSAPAADAAPAAASGHTPDPATPVDLKVVTTDGVEFDVAAHRGKWLVVNFWATWCHPCLAEMPALSKMDAQREDIEVLGLAYDDIAPDALKAFLKQHPVGYPIAQVDVYAPPKAFPPPEGLPTTYLLDPQGKVAERFVGPVTPEDIQHVVDAGSAGTGQGARQ